MNIQTMTAEIIELTDTSEATRKQVLTLAKGIQM